MNITFVIPHDSLAGGVRVVAIYAKRLQQRGHSVTVVSAPQPRPNLKQRLKSLLQPQGALARSGTSYFEPTVRRYTLDQYRPLQDSDLPDADVVIATWWETAEWIAPLSAAKGTKVYFIQHHEVFDYLPQRRVESTYRLPFFQITVAQWLADILQNCYQSKAVSLVSNGVDPAQFYSPVRLKGLVPTVGLVYSTTPWKGVDIALKAFEQAQTHLPTLNLIAFGVEHPATDLQLPANAQYFFQPPQDCLKTLYAQCDAWLFSSRSEGFGLPILEAMACRTPVIATPVGAAPELLSKGGGVLLDDNQPMLMAQAIQTICTLEAQQWQQVSQQAYQIACEHSWEDATVQFEAALYQAVSAQG